MKDEGSFGPRTAKNLQRTRRLLATGTLRGRFAAKKLDSGRLLRREDHPPRNDTLNEEIASKRLERVSSTMKMAKRCGFTRSDMADTQTIWDICQDDSESRQGRTWNLPHCAAA